MRMRLLGIGLLLSGLAIHLQAAGLEPSLVDAVKRRGAPASRRVLAQHARLKPPETYGPRLKVHANARTIEKEIPIAFTPLLFAVRADAVDAAKALVELGANANETTTDGTSALVIAVTNAHWDMASLLMDKGADPN